jgi:hypothetical protein
MGGLPQPRRILPIDGLADPRQGAGGVGLEDLNDLAQAASMVAGSRSVSSVASAGGASSAVGRPASNRSMTRKSSAAAIGLAR